MHRAALRMQSGEAEGAREVAFPKTLALKGGPSIATGMVRPEERVVVLLLFCFVFKKGFECVCMRRGKNG